VGARNRVVARTESRGKASYVVAKTRFATAPLLDTRFVRAKSPRSRQYLIRAPRKVLRAGKQVKLGELVAYRALLSSRVSADKKSISR
jgi:hypothetical protein